MTSHNTSTAYPVPPSTPGGEVAPERWSPWWALLLAALMTAGAAVVFGYGIWFLVNLVMGRGGPYGMFVAIVGAGAIAISAPTLVNMVRYLLTRERRWFVAGVAAFVVLAIVAGLLWFSAL